MKVLTRVRSPKWIIVSEYVGPKKKLKGLSFATTYTYYQRKVADSMVDKLNVRAKYFNSGPGRDFEFKAVPFPRVTDSPK